MSDCDVLVIGAGVAGCAISRLCADAGKRVLLLERQNHIGGAAYDCTELAGRGNNLYLLGRLAEFKYYNMDAVVARALALFRQLNG